MIKGCFSLRPAAAAATAAAQGGSVPVPTPMLIYIAPATSLRLVRAVTHRLGDAHSSGERAAAGEHENGGGGGGEGGVCGPGVAIRETCLEAGVAAAVAWPADPSNLYPFVMIGNSVL